MDVRRVAHIVLAQADDGTGRVDEVETAIQQAQISGWDVLVAVLVLVAAIPIGSLVRRVVERGLRKLDTIPPVLAADVARFARWIVYILAIGIALAVLGMDFAWVALITIFALIITVLTVRPVIENTAAALVLTMRPAFGVGDEISVAEWRGAVTEIGSHATVLRTVDGIRIHIPNTEMLKQTVQVLTAFDARRAEFDLTVPAGTDLSAATSCIADALANVDGLVADPVPEALVAALDQDAIVIRARFWYPSSMATDTVPLSDAIQAVRGALVAAGIEPGGPTSAVELSGRLDAPLGDTDTPTPTA